MCVYLYIVFVFPICLCIFIKACLCTPISDFLFLFVFLLSFIHIFLCLSLHYMYLYLYLYPIFPYLSLYFCICNRGELVRTADLSVAGQGDASGQLRLHKMRKSISIRHRSQTSTSAFSTISVVSRSTSKMSITLSTRLVISLVRAQE